MSVLFETLRKRGFVDQVTHPTLAERLDGKLAFYLGIDPTAPSPHLGNYVAFMVLSHLAKAGHQPVVLIGGATGLVGDPSGRDLERPILSREEVSANKEQIKQILRRILQRTASGIEPIFVDNLTWYENMNVLTFLREVGKSFRMGPMLAKESVKNRVQSDTGMSFTEFSYQLLQGYDFVHLLKGYNVVLQIGGSDQWGNITAGCEYVRKKEQMEVYGLTFPLLTRSDGKKFGKSEEGAIWLAEELYSPYQLYQYLLRVPDADVVRFLHILTLLDSQDIAQLQNNCDEPNALQKILAAETTALIHGKEGLEKALKATQAATHRTLDIELLDEMADDLPHVTMPIDEVQGKRLIDIFASSGCLSSKGEARRLFANHGAYLNSKKVFDEHKIIEKEDILPGNKMLLGAGKKKKLLLLLVETADRGKI